MNIETQLPALQVVIPLLGAILCAFLRRGILAWLWTCLISAILPVISLSLLLKVQTGGPISYALGNWAPPLGIEYRVDMLSALLLLLISGIGAVMMPFARRSVAAEIDQDKQAWFYSAYLLCITGLLGIVITGDAFNAFVFLEISSLATYILIALGRDRRALLAAYQYLIMGTIGATFYVIGIGLLFTVTGSLNLIDIAQRIDAIEHTRAVLAALAFLTVGISLKLALFPLHVWLPNAYAYAPSFVSAFLAATATKVAVYLLIRFFYSVFGVAFVFNELPISTLMLGLSLAAMFAASFVAIFQDDLKRMLAYSSVGQIGYITLGISLANREGLAGGIVHIANHAMIKAALFLALGAVVYRLGSVRLGDLAGIGRKMPATMTAFSVAAAAIIGVPGTVGFISKWYLSLGALANGQWWLVLLIVASSLLSVVYMGRVLDVVWFREPEGRVLALRDPPASMLVPILLFAFATVYFGLDTGLTADVAWRSAGELIGGLK